MDPDDFLKAYGAAAFKKALDSAIGLPDALCLFTLREKGYVTPDQRAACEKQVEDYIEGIPDRRLQYHYRQHCRRFLRGFFHRMDRAARKAASAPPTVSNLAKSRLTARNYAGPSHLTMGRLLREGPQFPDPGSEET